MAAASIIASVITGGSNNHQTVAEELNAYASDFVNQGVVGAITLGAGSTPGTGAFAVTQDSSPDMGVTVLLGNCYVSGTPSGQDAQVIRARMTSNYTAYAISANSSGSTKYDWIYLQLSAANANNPSSAADNVITLVTSRSTSNASDNGSPPTYGILLAVVTVVNGASSITNANISDRRTQSSLSNINSGGSTGWNSLGYALTYSANNGTKEFQATSPNDLTGILTPGMRFKMSRSVTPPTQSMAFASASSQYATKTSPAGITFTGPFTVEAWVNLQSYTGSNQMVICRFNNAGTTGGWGLRLTATGQIDVFYGTTSSFTEFASAQSLPLNRWVHIAAAITSVSGKTAVIYINGASVPITTVASSSTTLTQPSEDLRVGAAGGTAAQFLNGYLSEVRVWTVAQSAASIQNNMGINLVGNESNLLSLYQGSGNFNDATSNANNLTAQAGAIATQASNPYNATEYAIITKVSYSNPTTTVTLFTGTDYTIPNQTINSPYYGTVKVPFGFPVSVNKWVVDAQFRNQTSQASAVSGTWYNLATAQLSIPTGEWVSSYKNTAALTLGSGSSSPQSVFNTLSTANNTELDAIYTMSSIIATSSTTELESTFFQRFPISLATQTTYYLNTKTTSSGSPTIYLVPDGQVAVIKAECAYV